LDNRLTRYLTYAAGEVVLIVIGIFIALQINNWNEARKRTKEVYSQLAQVHADLGEILEGCDLATVYYAGKDEAIHAIMSGSLTAEDYNDPETRNRYTSAATSWWTMRFMDSGYTSLVSNEDAIPDDLVSIFFNLKKIHTMFIGNVYAIQDDVAAAVDKIDDRKRENTSWYAERYFETTNEPLSEEAIAFYLSDPEYRKFVQSTYVLAIEDHYKMIISLRNQCVVYYEKLGGLLDLDEKEDLSCNIHVEDYSQWLGKYAVGQSNDSRAYETGTILVEGDHLIFAPDASGEEPFRLFPLRERSWWGKYIQVYTIPTFTDPTGLFYYTELAEDGTVIGLSARIGNKLTRYKKIE